MSIEMEYGIQFALTFNFAQFSIILVKLKHFHSPVDVGIQVFVDLHNDSQLTNDERRGLDDQCDVMLL